MRRGTLVLVAVAGLACGNRFKPELYATPADLFQAAKTEYEHGNCGGAIRGFTRLLFELPARDPRLAETRYLLGECRLREGDYLEASRELRRVADDFPSHELAPTALMRAGDALARLWKRPELDPTYGEQALSVYSEVLQRFPNAPPAAETRQRSQALQDKFALKDLKNGNFYFRIRAYDSAIIYYRSVVASWPESRHVPEALLKLVATYRRIGYEEEAAETCEHLRRFYADAPDLDDACPAVPAP